MSTMCRARRTRRRSLSIARRRTEHVPRAAVRLIAAKDGIAIDSILPLGVIGLRENTEALLNALQAVPPTVHHPSGLVDDKRQRQLRRFPTGSLRSEIYFAVTVMLSNSSASWHPAKQNEKLLPFFWNTVFLKSVLYHFTENTA